MKLLVYLIFLLVSFHTQLALALSENTLLLDSTAKLIPFIKEWKKFSFYSDIDRLPIKYYNVHEVESEKCLFIVPGKGEASFKFAEFLYDLKSDEIFRNYNIFIIDHRGQGLSGRLLPNAQKVYVKRFHDYALDLKQFIQFSSLEYGCAEKNIIAHSMGALVVLDYLQSLSPLVPNSIHKVVLMAPMIKIKSDLPETLLKIIVGGSDFINLGKDYAKGEKPYQEDFNESKLKGTHSEVRARSLMSIYNYFPEVKKGGVTWHWLNEAIQRADLVKNSYNRIKIENILVFSPKLDQHVSVLEIGKACASLKKCQLKEVPHARHDLILERDDIRTGVMQEIKDYFEKIPNSGL